MKITLRVRAFLCTAVLLLSGRAVASPYSRMVVFGDSYSDEGNYSPGAAGYYRDRWSNGPVWVEDLAAAIGTPVPSRSIGGGANATNFAYGGAVASGSSLTGVPDVATQVGQFLQRGTPGPADLFVIEIGTNDILRGHYGGVAQSNPAVTADAVVSQIRRLTGRGAKTLLVTNVVPLGSFPGSRGTPEEANFNRLVDHYNQTLADDIASLNGTLGNDVRLIPFDWHAVYADVLANPAAYHFTNVRQGAFNVGARDPDNYAFWDDYHPTRQMHQILAERALTVVPEPAALAVLGLCGLTLLRRRRFHGHRQTWEGESLEPRLLLSTYTVTSLADSGPGSLRDALQQADASPGADTVMFDPALTAAGPASIVLSSPLALNDAVTIKGPGADLLALDGNSATRVLLVSEPADATVDGLRITHGRASPGGGILNLGTLTLEESAVSLNTAPEVQGEDGVAPGVGGGIYNDAGTLTIADSTVSGNWAQFGDGGGIFSIDAGNLTVTNSTVSGNSAAGQGGGIFSISTALISIKNSDISGNRAARGAGISIDYEGSTEGSNLVLTNSTITGNVAGAGGGGGIYNRNVAALTNSTVSMNSAAAGGGIDNSGTLTLTNSNVTQNSATGGAGAGGITNDGTLTLTNSTVSDNSANFANSANAGGGGIINSGTLTLRNSTVSGNSVRNGDGGGIYNTGTLTIINSTISENIAFTVSDFGTSAGGGIHNSGTLTLTNSTVLRNSAHHGGGIDSPGPIEINNSTLTRNQAYGGGGGARFPNGNARANNTIFSGNIDTDAGSPSDVAGALDSDSHSNLIGTGGSGGLVNGINGNMVGVADAGLAPLGDYGGPTQTMPLLSGSPAIDAGDASLLPADSQDLDGDGNTAEPLPLDQRGLARESGQALDIGAFERTRPIVDTAVDESDGDFRPRHLSLREALAQADLNPGTESVTFSPALTGSGPVTLTLLSELVVGGEVVVTGPGVDLLTIDGNRSTRVLEVAAGAVATVTGVTIANGRAGRGDGGGIVNGGTLTLARSSVLGNNAQGNGGGVYNRGTMTIAESTVSSNSATVPELGFPFEGGGIYNAGTLTLTDDRISNNSAARGGGVFNIFFGALTLDRSTVSGNTGGGIANFGTVSLINSSVSRNSAVDGGGIYNSAGIPRFGIVTLTAADSTIADNIGGGIRNDGTATLSNCSVSGNSANDVNNSNGGGISNRGTLTLMASTVSGNSANGTGGSGNGGGIFNSGRLTLLKSTVAENVATGGENGGAGGGIFNQEVLTLINSTISRNTASNGGGIYNHYSGTLTLMNASISVNSARNNGGGAYITNARAVFLADSTFTANRAAVGGGLWVLNEYGYPIVLRNSIVAGNFRGTSSTADDATGPLDLSQSRSNLIGTGGSGGLVNGVNGNIVGVADAGLAPLGDYGGPTQTMPLLAGSPAIDAGDASLLPADSQDLDGDGNTSEPLPLDQRGTPRVSGGKLDIGAYEYPASIQMLGVFARGSAWSTRFKQYLADQGLGDAGDGYRVNPGDTLPWVNVDQLVLSFDRDLPAAPLPGRFTIHGVGSDYGATVGVLDARSVVLTLDRPLGSAGGDRFHVTDPFFGGDFDLRFNALPGDADASGSVLATDFSAVKRKFFSSTTNPGTGDAAYGVFADVNGSGSILADDYSEVKRRFFTKLPGGDPAPAAVAPATAALRVAGATRDLFSPGRVLA